MSSSSQPITLTESAARQVAESAAQADIKDTALRFAVEKLDSGQFRYAMGFDDVNNESDLRYQSQGIDIVVAPDSIDLLDGTVMDYVELDNGEKQFVFLNPNDPNYSPASSS
ncbi:MAG: iron-sulfur cluster assembly accessory protein [Gammaproteobacteria bacterium]|nr:iron-sulfur cluster assembly accessory protein [Gammaproteobacteria bacterium]